MGGFGGRRNGRLGLSHAGLENRLKNAAAVEDIDQGRRERTDNPAA